MPARSPRFLPYTEVPSALTPRTWRLARAGVLAAILATAVYLCVDAPRGLMLFWQVLMPSLPLLFAVAPGLWRQVCPMAAANQLPVERGWSKGLALPPLARDAAYLVAAGLFVAAIVLRRPWLAASGPATAALIIASLAGALAGGMVFKGRSGWCGTFCPLGPVQKLYGHAPLVIVPNGYCPTCVGCQRNCYDFNPAAALHADLDELPPEQAGHRALFAGMLPGLVLAAWLADPYGQHGWQRYLAEATGYILGSLGAFHAARSLLSVGQYRLIAVFAMGALVLFYWFEAAPMTGALSALTGIQLPYPAASYLIIAAAMAVAAKGLVMGHADEQTYHAARKTGDSAVLGVEAVALREGQRVASQAALRERTSGRSFALDPARSLLDILEGGGLRLGYGCRSGVCGADPVVVIAGAEHLSAPDAIERATLQRLGLDGRARMACVCRASGPVEIEAGPDLRVIGAGPAGQADRPDLAALRGIGRVVVIGNGVAGTTAADLLRQASPGCRIDLIASESHHFYNRMALGRVVGNRSGLDGIHLMPPSWFDQRQITVWLNTIAQSIEPARRAVHLGTGETLAYDRLILATGGAAIRPDVPGNRLPGVFVLREADDALRMRGWIQSTVSREAVVVGGGMLGIEAAGILTELGQRVTLVHTHDRLMNRYLDAEGAGILERFLAGKGIDVRLGATVERIDGQDRVQGVRLADGDLIEAQLCLFCVGVKPNVALAAAAGLETRQGIVVDTRMQTSHPDIFAIGDAAEIHDAEGLGAPTGLWTLAAEHAERAVAAILDRPLVARDIPHAVHLKMDGIDVRAFGAQELTRPGRRVLADPDAGDFEQRKIVIENGRVVAAAFVGPPGTARPFPALVSAAGLPAATLAELERGNWAALTSGPRTH